MLHFLQASQHSDDRDLYIVAILSGARVGELMALTWADVGDNSLSLNRAVSRIPGQGIVVTT
jgi:integrase